MFLMWLEWAVYLNRYSWRYSPKIWYFQTNWSYLKRIKVSVKKLNQIQLRKFHIIWKYQKIKYFTTFIVDELLKSDKISDQESLSNEDVHFGIRCNSCDMSPICGMRFKCSECVKFNLCGGCLKNGSHNHHKMQSSHNRKAVPTISYPGKNVIRVTYGNR